MHTLTTCLCFKDQAEEAVRFYASVFSELKITGLPRCGANEFGGPAGSVRTVSFELFGQAWLAVNGGPHFAFNDGVSLVVNCDTQDEIDRLWTTLTADGGAPLQCGWLKDKFGLPWQIVPRIVGDMMSDPDADRANRVMQALLQMTKLNIAALKQAYGHA